MIDLTTITSNLEQTSDGIWRSKSSSSISYPDWGNEACFQIEDASFWFRHRNACILEAMRQFPPPGPVFDIGGGNGFVAKGMQDAGIDVVLVEPGEAGAANAQRRGIRSVICATLADAGLPPASMPAVGLFDVVEHMADDREFLAMIHDHLVPSGKVYITVPAYNALWSQEDIDAGHYRRYSRHSLHDLLSRSGFSVLFLTGFFQFLLPPILLARALPFRLGLAKPMQSGEVADRMKAQHVVNDGLPADILSWLLRRETNSIRRRRETRYGASWLLVASKI
jgi:SAM-dependent methyltransferase